ncbi:MAG: DNA primase [Lentisphaerae bacterium]|nr:DNA primase [Lentisphaerota bacterium]
MGSRVTDRAIEEIRARADIVELVAARGVALKRAGTSFKGCCPFHQEKTPSFHVNPAKQFYHCFGCGEHGDVFTFLMKQDGLSFMDAVRSLADKTGVVIDTATDYESEQRNRLYAIHLELAAFYQRCLAQSGCAASARAYLESRKLAADTVARFGIGYAPLERGATLAWAAKHNFTAEQLVAAGVLTPPNDPSRPDDYYDRFRGRLMFPITDPQGRVVAFSGRILDPKAHPAKYVNSPETPIFRKGKILYALDKARGAIVKHPRREAVICEGQIDVIRCHAAGLTTAVASQGTAFTRDHVDLLKHHADSAVLFFDGDTAGRKAAIRTGALFLEAGIPVRVAGLPPGEDPDSLIRDRGAEAAHALIDTAESLTAFQIRAMREGEERPDDVDAVSRICRAVLETLAACSNAVLRSHLLQEAAARLRLPEAALTEDLEALRVRQTEAAARAAAYGKSGSAPAPQQAPATQPGFDEEPPPHDPFSSEEAADHPTDDAPGTPAEAAPESATPADLALAELLFHHEDDLAVADLLRTYLPEALVRHPHAHTVFCAWRAAADTDALADLYAAADPALKAFLDPVILRLPRVNHSEELSPLDAARDIVTRLWIDALRAERTAIGDDPADDASRLRRLILTRHIKILQQATIEADRLSSLYLKKSVTSWELREPVIREEQSRLAG